MLVCRNVDWFGFLDCCWTYYLEGEVMDVQKIKELALANGFSLKEQASGNMDLHSYVYEFANAIEQAVKAQAVPEGFVLVEKKEFEQMQEFEDLYRRAIFNSKKSIHEVNWSHVSNLGVGSTRAKAMCKRFNIDPEATFRKPQEPTND